MCEALGLVLDNLYRVLRSVILALGREIGAGGSGIGDYPLLHSEFETMLQVCQRGKRYGVRAWGWGEKKDIGSCF